MISPDREIVFDDTVFVFETVMRVRNNETGVGDYLTLQSLAQLLSEAQDRFLYAKGLKQIQADYQGLIVNDVHLHIVSMVRARVELLFEVGIKQLLDDGCDINIKVTRKDDGSVVAKSIQHVVNYDYRLHKITAFNNSIKRALDTLDTHKKISA